MNDGGCCGVCRSMHAERPWACVMHAGLVHLLRVQAAIATGDVSLITRASVSRITRSTMLCAAAQAGPQP